MIHSWRGYKDRRERRVLLSLLVEKRYGTRTSAVPGTRHCEVQNVLGLWVPVQYRYRVHCLYDVPCPGEARSRREKSAREVREKSAREVVARSPREKSTRSPREKSARNPREVRYSGSTLVQAYVNIRSCEWGKGVMMIVLVQVRTS
jgi:hypothetical protein